MREINPHQFRINQGRETSQLFSALLLIVVAVIGVIAWFVLESDAIISYSYPNCFPWLFLTFLATSSPFLYYWYKGKFDLFNPIIFASWSYFLPVFVIGGLIFTSGFYQPYYTYLIQDPNNDLPWTFIYVSIGFIGLWIGFEIPMAKRLGLYFSAKLPDWDWTAEELIIPGYVLLGIGIVFNITTWVSGILMGFQRSDQVDALDNLQYFLSLIVLEGAFLLWMVIFKSKKRDSVYYITLFIQIIIIPLRAVFAGSRGSLLQLFIMVTMAYFFSGNKLNLKKGMVFTGFLTAAVLVGMIWGTTFRNIKGNDNKVSTGEYFDTVGQTVDSISSNNFEEILTDALNNFSERLENFSVLAVIVSNYEKLAPYEEAYGLKDNIWTYTWTAFIPRIIWQDKPIISGARSYSELYFDYGENSFPVTPIGDLLRNFGPYGIAPGMFILGLFLSFLYHFLLAGKQIPIWCGMTYFMIITKVSYEGFYGTILPDVVRTSFIVAISMIIIKLIVKKTKSKRAI